MLYYKSLAEDKFHWPKPDDELLALTGQQLNWLLDGYNLNAMKPHKKRHYESCF
ncbi:IS66 family insertion sequence element accessory protein TnpB [Endozoicomonas ascidiicola]|uniref:IS66 family insertion sequence element accessory protein TnpB n=1 Tax=Endozoicomonas ascidiicola TaxID=1698521 RepID=UPI0012FA7642